MSTAHQPSHWLRTKKELTPALVEHVSAKSFVHPVDLIEPEGDEVAKGVDMFKSLLAMCLPTTAHGWDRKLVGYRRMCVFVYAEMPSYFNGMSKKELAKYLGISPRALRKELAHVKTLKANALKNNL